MRKRCIDSHLALHPCCVYLSLRNVAQKKNVSMGHGARRQYAQTTADRDGWLEWRQDRPCSKALWEEGEGVG